jgi:N-methylhydantoinase A
MSKTMTDKEPVLTDSNGTRLRVGVDVGGTFTDLAIIDEATGELTHMKGLSTPSDPSQGTLELIRGSGIKAGDVWIVVHGTTVVINTLVERTGARTGLITTRGFRDILEIRHGGRSAICTPFLQNPKPFIPRELRCEVAETVWFNGEVTEQLELDELERAIEYLSSQGVESIAVCFMNSYANDAHERAVGDRLDEAFAGLHYTLSSEVAPLIGEYERFSTAMINAYVQPRAEAYLGALEDGLRKVGVNGNLYVMQSNGGIVEASVAGQQPVKIVESGPAGGVMASLAMGQVLGCENLITFDMGGTTSKASIIERGEARLVTEFELAGIAQRPGSGWPLVVAMIDIPEIGLGGGSIAWLSREGALHVGPRSAGAEPGPICYGRGGTSPTLTDANLVLGLLDTLLDGEMDLDATGPSSAIEEQLARPLGLEVREAARGVRKIAIAQTADLLREVSVSRGLDPADFTMVAYGGAGPMHACDLMAELGIKRVIVPPSPGTFSALGLVYTDLRSDFATTHIAPGEELTNATVARLFAELEERAADAFHKQGFEGEIVVRRSVDLRYVGQVHQVTVPLSAPDAGSGADLSESFHRIHEQLFSHSFPAEPVESVNFRIAALGMFEKPPLRQIPKHEDKPLVTQTREVFLYGNGAGEQVPVLNRQDLGAGFETAGPLIVDEYSATTVVPPGVRLRVDEYGNMWIETEGSSR